MEIVAERKSLICGAGGRDRTGTGLAAHGILSPRRLPIPPLRHAHDFEKLSTSRGRCSFSRHRVMSVFTTLDLAPDIGSYATL